MGVFEITIHRKDDDAWPIVVRHQPGAHELTLWSRGWLNLDLEALVPLLPSDKAYGLLLGKALFREDIRDAFVRAVAEAKTVDEPLRLLLNVEADDLRRLHWEQLHAPLDRGWNYLLLNQGTPFSLYLPSQIQLRFPPIGRRDLRVLVLVAGPEELEGDYDLAPFSTAATVESIQHALGEVPFDVLSPVDGAIGPPTLSALCEHLTTGSYTLLHIVCHGKVMAESGEMVLYFPEDENGRPVPATDLIEYLGRLERLPHLIFLSTCESADPQAEAGLGGLGQRLVRELGMPAVVAMTDRISIATAEALASAFYAQLRESGEVDCALSEALVGLQGRDDVTVPALFSRLGGRALFSDALDRPLTEAEIAYGLAQMRALIEQRAPVQLAEAERHAATVQSMLGREPAALSAEARRERQAALAAANQLCSQALDLSFNALALGQPPPAYDGRCPFRGLFPFRGEDREFFFGRQALVVKLSSRLMEHGFLAVLGPSGCGKSSLVLAGVVPALQARFPRLRVTYLTPGSEPLAQLEAALSSASREDGRSDLIIVDQFEELFSLCRHEGERQAFVDRLLALSAGTALVLTLRADFWGECAAYEALKDEMQTHQELVAPMDAAALRRAMERQADHVGLRFEAGLGEAILDDVDGEPGAMPLLQHALLLLWQRRHGRWLRWEEYRAVGGIQQAIAHTADEVYLDLAGQEQARMRDIFLRLTRLEDAPAGAEARDTRRRVGLAELVPAGSEPAETVALVKRLADARLVVTSLNPASGQEEVEVAHEALIRHWPRLRGWLEEDRAELHLREGVREVALEWEANDRDEAYLVHRGGRLEDAEALRQQLRFALNELEQAYVEACVALRERERREKEEQQRRELEAVRRLAAEQQARAEEQADNATRMRRRAVVIGAVGVVAIVLAMLSALFWRQAENSAARAEAEARIALSRQLAAQTLNALESEQPIERGLLLAVESLWATKEGGLPHTLEADDALRRSLALAPVAVLRHEGVVYQAVFSPDGTQLATGSADGTVRLWDVRSGGELAVLRHEDVVRSVVFSPDGTRLATGSYDGTARLWKASSGQELAVLRHEGQVRSVIFSPDGTRLATGSYDRTARLWDAGSGEELDVLRHEDVVRSVVFSPDGTRLATGSEDYTARLWDASSGEELAVLRHEDWVYQVVFSPDGTRLATGSYDGTARLWDPDSGGELAVLRHEAEVRSVAFSPDGTQLATGSADGTARLWDPDSGGKLAVLRHGDVVYQVVFSRDGTRLATGSADGTAHLWDADSSEEVAVLRHEGDVYAVALSPDGTRLATGSADGTARLWDAGSGQELAVLRHEDVVRSVVFSPDETRLVTGSADGTARLWDADSGQELAALRHEGGIRSVAFSPYGARLATGSQDGAIRLWDAGSGQELAVLRHEGGVWNVVFSPDGTRLATVSADGTARLWDAGSDEELAVLRHEGQVWSVVFSPDGTRLATGGHDGTARLWDAESGEELAVLHHEDWVYQVLFSPDETWLVTGSYDGTARLWDAGSGEELAVLRHEDVVDQVVFSPDGTRLATHSADGTARLWGAGSSEELAILRHEDWVYQVVFSPDGTRLATGSADGTARLWDPDSGGELAVLRHEAEVRSVAFSPDGTQLATGSADGTARLWDPDSGGELAVLRHGDEVYQVFFSPDGTRLVTGSEDGTARLWRVHPEDLATSACDIVNRNLTKDEWRQYLGDRPYRPTCPSLPVHPSVTRSLLDEGIGLAQKGEVEGAIAQFEEALELDPSLEIDAQTWKDLCWFGSLWGHSAVVLSACEQAVTLAPHDGDIHDCRGLARALTGDSKGAREDFEFYVDWLKQGGQHKPGGNGREAWIAELDAGENPFDEATLEDLRGQ